MPRICLKRSDIPEGLLQIEDLRPNESQRNPPYQPVGQSKYVRAPDNDTVATSGADPIVMSGQADGLAAWFIANVPDTDIVQSTGDLTVTAANADAGDSTTVGGVLFTATAGARTSGSNDFSIDSGTDAGIALDLLAAINDQFNLATGIVTASDGGAGVVDITAVALGSNGDAVTLATSDATFIAVSAGTLAGGTDGLAILAADANTIAQAILDGVLLFGDTSGPAVVATLAGINAVVTATITASITVDQLPDVLDILAGRIYRVASGYQVEAAGNFDPQDNAAGGSASFVTGTLRDVFTTGALRVSAQGGRLEGYLRTDFNYGSATGTNLEALVIYNDDGTLFTP